MNQPFIPEYIIYWFGYLIYVAINEISFFEIMAHWDNYEIVLSIKHLMTYVGEEQKLKKSALKRKWSNQIIDTWYLFLEEKKTPLFPRSWQISVTLLQLLHARILWLHGDVCNNTRAQTIKILLIIHLGKTLNRGLLCPMRPGVIVTLIPCLFNILPMAIDNIVCVMFAMQCSVCHHC